MAKYAHQEHVIYTGAQFLDYAGEAGMVTDARETHLGQHYLVLLDSGAQILVAEDDLSLPPVAVAPAAAPVGDAPPQEVASEPEAPDAPVTAQEAQEAASHPETPQDTTSTPQE